MRNTLLVVAMSAFILVACGKKEEAAVSAPAGPSAVLDDTKVLNIYNWPDYVPEGMIAAFEKEFGIKVNYDTFETNEALHAKLVAGNSGYDIVVPGAVFAKMQIDAGFFQSLKKDRIPNLANLDPAVMATLTKVDPNNAHLVPWGWGFTTVGINKTKVEKALAGMPMPENAWDLVFKPEYTSRLRSCGIAYLDSPSEILPVALHYIGKDAYSNDPADYRAAVDMMLKVRKDVRMFSATMIDDIAGGKACAVIGWSGDINQAAARVKENGGKDVIEALLPSTGALIFFDNMAVTKDAKHPNNAMAFINFFLRPENAAAMANEVGYPTGNKAAIGLVDPDIANNKTIFVESNYMAKMIPPGSFTNEAREAMASAYNTLKKGR
ncbi:MAG: extracellular solute-binding protein [Betaproteobacteria bacterium]|nr:extracellular solute-binding protein [Betaproteobacteria bacterium]